MGRLNETCSKALRTSPARSHCMGMEPILLLCSLPTDRGCSPEAGGSCQTQKRPKFAQRNRCPQSGGWSPGGSAPCQDLLQLPAALPAPATGWRCELALWGPLGPLPHSFWDKSRSCIQSANLLQLAPAFLSLCGKDSSFL